MWILGIHLMMLLASGYGIRDESEMNKEVPSSGKHTAFFVFGDSVYDPGNANFLIWPNAQRWPYGETFFHFPTGRSSDGRLIPDFVATYMGLPLWRPYLQPGNLSFLHGANFAVAGATVLADNGQPGLVDFFGQLNSFKQVTDLIEQLGEENATQLLNEAIYLSDIGNDDYTASYIYLANTSETEQKEFVNMVVGNITEGVKEVYRLGGRKFVFQNAGPLGCLPKFRIIIDLFHDITKCNELLNALASYHNEVLVKAVAVLESQLSEFKYMIFDFHSLLLYRIYNPSDYGFIDVTNPCCDGYDAHRDCGIEPYTLCSDPSEYLWFDIYHPTEHAYMQLAELLWEGGSNATTPYTMKQLFELELNSSSSTSRSII